jgi:programmed cell death protein 5
MAQREQVDGMPTEEQLLNQQAQQAEIKEQRDSILQQIMEPDAKTRLVRLALVKPDLVAAVEDTLIRAATGGQLKGMVTDSQLKKMLEQFADEGGGTSAVGSAGAAKKKVVVQRKKSAVDDDEDDDDDSDLL